MRHSDIIDKIKPIIHNILQDNGVELVDITYRRESAGNVLRVSADREAGITIDVCVSMNKIISNALDESALMEDRYILEVASPGIDRPLKSKDDFLKVRGKMIRVHTYMAIDRKREFTGILGDVREKEVFVLTDAGVMVTIPFDKISSAKLHF